MPRLDWQMWFEGLRAERYLSQPFPRFLYGRFLNIIANGGGQKECFDLNYVLGEEEMRAFAQAPPRQKQLIIQNFQNLMNAFLGQSKWFGEFLQACLERNLVILNELEDCTFRYSITQFFADFFFSLSIPVRKVRYRISLYGKHRKFPTEKFVLIKNDLELFLLLPCILTYFLRMFL
jgi:hypothetical protein